MLQLREYQAETHRRMDAAEARGVRRQLVHAATGLGKTVIFSTYARQRGGRAVVLAHRDELVTQAAAKVLEVWPELGATDAVRGLLLGSDDAHLQALARHVDRNPLGVGIVKADADDVAATVVVASVQTLSRPKRLARLVATTTADGWSLARGTGEPIGLVVVDEAHHAAADTYRRVLAALRAGEPEQVYQADTGRPDAIERVPAGPLLVGVTATPDRGDGKGLDDLFQEIVASWDLLWGIRSGYLADLRGVAVRLDRFDTARLKVSRGDYDQGAAGRALADAGAPEFIVHAWLADHPLPGGDTVTARGRKTLVFTPTVALAESVAAEFVGAGVPAGMVSGETPLDDRRRILGDFRAGRLTVLANCAVLTEGYDEPSVQCIVVARPTKSRALYCFDAATEVLTPTGWVPGNVVHEGATIAAFDPASGAVRWEPVLATVNRRLLPGERMMALRGPTTDVRVTDTHRMVWRRRVGRSHQPGPWVVSTAAELAARTDSWDLPCAGVEDAPGVPLTDAELAFIGWVQTDGCVNHTTGAIQIAQQRPEQRQHIEATLTACGFKWRVSETNEPTAYGPRRHPLAVYRVSRGAPRGADRHLRGWGALHDWLPKADDAAWRRLEAMDARQWAVFLDAWHRGDGSKQEGQSWTRRGYHLAVADKWVAGWLQATCMRRGWRCNVTQQANLWMVHCREGVARTIAGSAATDRPRLVPTVELLDERVWCVSVPSGAILTRRNGKGAIVGQTQMVGRGTRLHPEKDHCLVLDVVGASSEHSLVTAPSLFGIDPKVRDYRPGESLTTAITEQEHELVRLGRLTAEEADLFATVRRQGLAWVAIHKTGDTLRRYVLSLGKDQHGDPLPLVVLAQRQADADVWTSGLQWPDGRKQVLLADTSMETAQGAAEVWVRAQGPRATALADSSARWRQGRPSPAQLGAAAKWHLTVDPKWNAGQLTDAMNAHIARIKARKGKPPRKAARR